jgi:hypothetical protein
VSIRNSSVSLIAVAALAATAALAHHSFAMFDLSRHLLVEGRVTSWDFNNPHSWLHIEGLDEEGRTQTWSFEGAAPMHAARQGVSGATFRKGEFVRVVMSPLRDGRPAGAMCFVIKEDGSVARPNDGTCDALAVIETWQRNGWIDSTAHLAGHPVASSAVEGE